MEAAGLNNPPQQPQVRQLLWRPNPAFLITLGHTDHEGSGSSISILDRTAKEKSIQRTTSVLA